MCNGLTTKLTSSLTSYDQKLSIPQSSGRMNRNCPGCGTVIPYIGGLKVTLREKGDVWYRRSPRRLYCKSCGQQLRVLIQPVGHLLNAVMILGLVGYCAFILRHPPSSIWWLVGTALGLVFVIIALGRCFQVWGVRFALASKKPGVIGSFVTLRRATTGMYSILTVLPAAALAILVYAPPRLTLAWVFSTPQSRSLALVLSGLAVGSLLVAVLVPRANTRAVVRRLMIPAVALVGLAYAWGLFAALFYALGLGYLLLLQRQSQ